jgi:K(+)-stimulated pyrophosphate-energized sodium pump
MQSVGRAAMDMVNEVRRQFREIPGLLEGTGKAEYGKCVEISTKAALREMMPPGLITIITPIVIGFVMGRRGAGRLHGRRNGQRCDVGNIPVQRRRRLGQRKKIV